MKNKRKIIAIITLICFLLSSHTVFAAGSTSSKADQSKNNEIQTNSGQGGQQDEVKTNGQGSLNGQQEKAQMKRNWNQELKESFQQVNKNNVEIIRLRNQLAQTRRQVDQTIKALREQEEPLTEEQLQELRQQLQIIKQDKVEIKEEIGNIHKEVVRLRVAKKGEQIDSAREILQEIMNRQQERIELLKKTIEDLNGMNEIEDLNATNEIEEV